MLIKILWEDIRKNKSITIALFVFIMLAALLVSSGSNMMTELSNSLNALFTKARAPHFVQMHTGDVNQAEMDAFSSNNNLVDQQQTAEMVLIDGGHIKLGAGETERNSVMDHYFVKQNKAFDFLLNLESQVIHVGKGEIAVPVFYKQQKGLKRGDKIHISNNSRHLELTIVDFVRDVQMNPSIVHSKRFVVNDRGFNALKQDFGDIEYLLEFRLTDDGKLEDFRRAYENANLPNKGPAVDYALFKLLNAVTDGMIAIIIMVMSMVLIGIAILCMRFTIMTAMEEDYQAIGVMKAIGIAQDQIKRIYLVKYVVLAACACLLGYVLSLFFHPFFTANMMDDIGTATMPVFLRFIPLLAVILLFFMVILFCRFTLRKLHQISATEALRSGGRASTAKHKRYPALSKRRWIPVPVFLGLQDVVKRFSTYRLLCFVFLVCTFLITVPVNFLHTIQSPDFIRYMGIGRSDIRIDLQQTGESARDFHNMKSSIAQDPDVERFSPHVTNQYKVINQGACQKTSLSRQVIFPNSH